MARLALPSATNLSCWADGRKSRLAVHFHDPGAQRDFVQREVGSTGEFQVFSDFGRSLLGVIRIIPIVRRSLPLYPNKQTILEPIGTSHLGHIRPGKQSTSCPSWPRNPTSHCAQVVFA